jgi:hypothetical protein
MSIQSTTFIGVGRGFSVAVSDGKTVSCILPAGCVVVRESDEQVVSVPLVHSGADTRYRPDCVVYHGTPVTASLEIA